MLLQKLWGIGIMLKKTKKTVSKRDVSTATKPAEHSKEKLLKAAFEVFSKYGFHGATTKQIAQTAEVNEALIMRHFQSKQGLFIAVIEKNLSGHMMELTYPIQATFEEEVVKFCLTLFDRDCEKADFLRITISHALQDQGFTCAAEAQILNKRESQFIPRLKSFQEKGELSKKHDLEAIETMLSRQTFAAVMFSCLMSKYTPQEARESLRTAAKVIAQGLLK